MWARLQEVEANVNAGIPIEDAKEMVSRYAAAATDGASGEAQERSDGTSDEDIARIVEASLFFFFFFFLTRKKILVIRFTYHYVGTRVALFWFPPSFYCVGCRKLCCRRTPADLV